MQEVAYVSAKDFCMHHHIELSFIQALHEYGLIEGAAEHEDYLLPQEQVSELERLVRLHYDLHINLEGIDVVYNMLRRMEEMQREMASLRSRLHLYED